MRNALAWRVFSVFLVLFLAFGIIGPGAMAEPVAAPPAQDAATAQLSAGVYNSLRVYGRLNQGAGNLLVVDPNTGRFPEDPPYTDMGSVFDPQGLEAPRKDFITWNPAWMHEVHTPDENKGLYQQIYISGVNGAEKVHFRMWYEPRHLDKDINADGVVDDDDVTYPAVMQEFTYQLTNIHYTPGASPRRLPAPAVGQAGATQFVFPMAMRAGDLFDQHGNVDRTSDNARYGYGLTSLDPNFDGTPNIVQVHSEDSLATLLGLGANWLDFDGDGVRDNLSNDGVALTGDELVILALSPLRLSQGQSVMFLDYMITLQSVGDTSAVVAVRYVGDIVPDLPHTHTIPAGATRFLGRHGTSTLAPNNTAGVPPVSPFFAQIVSLNSADNSAVVRVGRGLGAPHASMESAPNVQNLSPGGPWFLKRFYVDGHEYNVTAIGTEGINGFRFITIRTPVPKVPVNIEQHSLRLQHYDTLDWLSVMPPFNHEHYIFTDIQALDAFDTLETDVDYVGRLVGPVPPILQRNGPFPYYGVNPNVPYGDVREMFLFYVEQDHNPQFLGEIKELYGEYVEYANGTPDEISQFWYVQQYWTQPWQYTDFVLPDLRVDRTGTATPDLYLLTSSWLVDQSELLQWTRNQASPLRYNLRWDPVEEEWVRDETVNDFSSTWWEREGVPRVQFWFNPAVGGKKYKDDTGIRLYGLGNEGPGYRDATDPGNSAYPVEVLPYSDPWAPFNPDLPEAPPKDSLTFNPVYMSRENSLQDPLRDLYGQISIEGADARQKVFMRMWYEPEYLDKIIEGGVITYTHAYTFPAVMQEFTYMMLDTQDRPAHGRPGETNMAFPMATGAQQLPRPDPVTGLLPTTPTSRFGWGLNSFDANFNGSPNIVTVHSEFSLDQYLNTVTLDFNGNGLIDYLDPSAATAPSPVMTGNEMVVLAVHNIHLQKGQSAQFLDYMITLKEVTATPLDQAQAQLQLWHTGGGAVPLGGGGYSLQPIPVPGPNSPTSLLQGDAAVAGGQHRAHVWRVPTGGDNLGRLDGGWFVYVHSVSRSNQDAVVTIGRALGATYSAMDDGSGAPDLVPGDPWYLKRFFVDGHEYNVVAIRAEYDGPAPANRDPTEFKYITIRTPVPKETFLNAQNSQVLQGYFEGVVHGVDTSVISVMPPYDRTRSIAEDILALEPESFGNPKTYDPDCCGISRPARVVPPLTIRITEEEREPQFFGEVKQILEPISRQVWQTQQYNTLPDRYTELQLPAGELYLLTSNWRSNQSLAHFYGCPLKDPLADPLTDGVPWNEQNELAALRDGDIPISIPYTNMGPHSANPRQAPTIAKKTTADYYDGLYDSDNGWNNSLRVKFWYDPNDPQDVYVNQHAVEPTVRAISLARGWNLISFDVMPFNAAIGSVLGGIAGKYDRVLAFDCNAGTPGQTYYPDLPGISSLHFMDPYHGYWVHMTQSATLTVQGVEVDDSSPLYLCAGWNLISYLPNAPLPVAAALNSLADVYTVVLGWDGGALSHYPELPPSLNTLHQLQPFHGYWVRITSVATQVYLEGVTVAAADLMPNVTASQLLTEGTTVIPTTEWVNFYGQDLTFYGAPLPVGSIVTAHTPDGTTCGEFVVQTEGEYGLMPCYKDDPETPEKEGAEAGEVISFRINGKPATVLGPDDPVWTSNGALIHIKLAEPLEVQLPLLLR